MRTALDPAAVAAELLRTALVAKLGVDLGDPTVARRAARQAGNHARLLSGLDLPRYEDADDEEDLDEGGPLPEVDALLAVRYPAAPEREAP